MPLHLPLEKVGQGVAPRVKRGVAGRGREGRRRTREEERAWPELHKDDADDGDDDDDDDDDDGDRPRSTEGGRRRGRRGRFDVDDAVDDDDDEGVDDDDDHSMPGLDR